MRRASRLLLVAGMIVTLFNTSEEVYAQVNMDSQILAENSDVTPQAEVTEYKYMTINGYLYKRLWSVTRGVWIDDRWTLA